MTSLKMTAENVKKNVDQSEKTTSDEIIKKVAAPKLPMLSLPYLGMNFIHKVMTLLAANPEVRKTAEVSPGVRRLSEDSLERTRFIKDQKLPVGL